MNNSWTNPLALGCQRPGRLQKQHLGSSLMFSVRASQHAWCGEASRVLDSTTWVYLLLQDSGNILGSSSLSSTLPKGALLIEHRQQLIDMHRNILNQRSQL